MLILLLLRGAFQSRHQLNLMDHIILTQTWLSLRFMWHTRNKYHFVSRSIKILWVITTHCTTCLLLFAPSLNVKKAISCNISGFVKHTWKLLLISRLIIWHSIDLLFKHYALLNGNEKLSQIRVLLQLISRITHNPPYRTNALSTAASNAFVSIETAD